MNRQYNQHAFDQERKLTMLIKCEQLSKQVQKNELYFFDTH